LVLQILFQTVPGAIKMRGAYQQAKLGETRRIYIVSSKSKTCNLWWNTFSQALREIDHTGNSLLRDALKENINSSWSGRKMEALRKGWQTWKRIGQFIGDQIGRLVLTVFYFTLFMPFALGVRLLGDPLAIRPLSRAKWLERTTHDLTLEDSRRLF
jgi:hypothetical protein